MKKFNFLFSSMLIAAFFMLTAMQCEDEMPNTRQLAAEALTATTWKVERVIWENVDLTAVQDPQYANFTISFQADASNPEVTGGTFTTTDSGLAFPEGNGNWEFIGEPISATSFNLNRVEKSVEMAVNVTTQNLKLTFEIPTSTARTNGTSGFIEFELVPAN